MPDEFDMKMLALKREGKHKMYLYKTVLTNILSEATAPKPFGPGFDEEDALKAEKMEVWATQAHEPGPDFCEFHLINEKGETFKKKRVEGY